MGTASYNKLATSTAIVKRSPKISSDGKRSAQAVEYTISITPPDTMDADKSFAFGTGGPISLWVVYYEGNIIFKPGDTMVIDEDSTQYRIKTIRVFKDFKRAENVSYEIVLELPEDQNKQTPER